MMKGQGQPILAFLLLGLVSVARCNDCKQDVNCRLPDCFCPTFEHPLGRNIPQIVYFGFDDAVTPQVAKNYNELFTSERKNPNGCPITMTLYISHNYTKYNLVNEFYKKGNEMAVHSVTHHNIDTAAKLLAEATEQKRNIEELGKVSPKDVIGWRSPNLKSAGDDQPRILEQLGYTYDNSLSYSKDSNYPFPFTLDYGYPYSCAVQPCPRRDSKHRGFWEIMIHDFIDPETDLPCAYVDSCRPTSKNAAVEYLWSNFLDTYEKEKAPFGLNMHAAWFAFDGYLPAMGEFIDRLLQLPDVYIVNVEQMMKWMRAPVTLSEARNFAGWGCDGGSSSSRYYKRSSDSVHTEVAPKVLEVVKSQVPNNAPVVDTPVPNHPPIVQAQVPKVPQVVESHYAAPSHVKNLTHLASGYDSELPHRYSGHRVELKATPQPTKPATEAAPIRTAFMQFYRGQNIYDGHDLMYGPSSCEQGVNCHLPRCYCKTNAPPKGLSSRDTPQIVYLTIDTHIDGRTYTSLMEIFSQSRVGSNNCPVTGSVFIPPTGNYPPYASALSNAGAKLGFSPAYRTGRGSVADEMNKIKDSFSAHYGMHPFGGDMDEIYDALQKHNDSFHSFVLKLADASDNYWPYTMNYEENTTGKYPGVWNIPLSPLKVPGVPKTCLVPQKCPYLYRSEIDTYKILKYNFNIHYYGDRSPFGININEGWLVGYYGQAWVKGFSMFLDDILKNSDVMVVSIDKMLEWIASSEQNGYTFSC